MNKESPKNDSLKDILPAVALLGAVGFLAFGAFSRDVAKAIKKRDGKDVWTGESGPLEAAHINHDRSSPNYNSPSNGRSLTPTNHYIDHTIRDGTPGLGLTKPANDAARRLIWERVPEEKKKNLPPPPPKPE